MDAAGALSLPAGHHESPSVLDPTASAWCAAPVGTPTADAYVTTRGPNIQAGSRSTADRGGAASRVGDGYTYSSAYETRRLALRQHPHRDRGRHLRWFDPLLPRPRSRGPGHRFPRLGVSVASIVTGASPRRRRLQRPDPLYVSVAIIDESTTCRRPDLRPGRRARRLRPDPRLQPARMALLNLVPPAWAPGSPGPAPAPRQGDSWPDCDGEAPLASTTSRREAGAVRALDPTTGVSELGRSPSARRRDLRRRPGPAGSPCVAGACDGSTPRPSSSRWSTSWSSTGRAAG